MDLNGLLLEKIQKALIDAFPDKDKLEQMLRFKCNKNLDVQGSSLSSIVFQVIKNFQSQDKLLELIEGALKANPNNLKLREVNEEVKAIYPINNKFIFDSFNEKLTPIIEQIDFTKCKSACHKVFPDLKLHLPNFYIKDTSSLKNLFLHEYFGLLSDGTLPILKFAHILACDKTLGESICQQLQDWIDSTVKKYNLKLPTFFEVELPELLRSYLLIIIKPEGNNQYSINAYLIPNEEDKDNIEPIDIELAEKGFLCTFDEIKQKIPEFIKISEKEIIDKTNNDFELTIEFFLPTEYLNEEVEHWEISSNRYLKRFIGDEYNVVVRSYERLIKPNFRKSLRTYLNRLRQVRDKLNKEIIQDVQDVFEHLEELETLDWRSLKYQLEKNENKIGLKLSCSFPLVSNQKYEELFHAILSSGIPIVIWKRSSSIPNDELDTFLSVSCLVRCNNLFNHILSKRQAAYRKEEEERKKDLGYHLGILCEEPNIEEFPDLKAAISKL